jgi:hypothetical protein
MLRKAVLAMISPVSFGIRPGQTRYHFVIMEILLTYPTRSIAHLCHLFLPSFVFPQSFHRPFFGDKFLPREIEVTRCVMGYGFGGPRPFYGVAEHGDDEGFGGDFCGVVLKPVFVAG